MRVWIIMIFVKFYVPTNNLNYNKLIDIIVIHSKIYWVTSKIELKILRIYIFFRFFWFKNKPVLLKKNFVFDFPNIAITILYFVNFQLKNNFKILSKLELVPMYLKYFLHICKKNLSVWNLFVKNSRFSLVMFLLIKKFWKFF